MRRRRRRLAPADVVAPPPEREQHNPVERLSRPIADAAGAIARPFRALSVLDQLERNGTITAPMAVAGMKFHDWFRLAALDPLRAAALLRVPGGGQPNPVGNEWARRKVGESLDWLGGMSSPAGDCAWFVVGLEWSLTRWARERQKARVHLATGVLVAALGVLAAKYDA
jgi:hypothetical protein